MTVSQRHALFGLFLIGLVPVFMEPLRRFLNLTLHGDPDNSHSTYILLIPFISAALIYFDRKRIFSTIRSSAFFGLPALAIAATLYYVGRTAGSRLNDNDYVAWMTSALIVSCVGGFLLIYGTQAFRAALFPLAFSALTIPIPSRIIGEMVLLLQKGSADLVSILFWLTGTPAYRNDMVFTLPGVAIQVAEACSGIRSTLGMIIVTLLASHLLLRSNWKKTALLAAVIPVSLFKNAVRIVVLTLLAIHYDMGFLTGSLHHEGGIVFMAGGLALLYPVLLLLVKSEEKNQFDTGVGSS